MAKYKKWVAFSKISATLEKTTLWYEIDRIRQILSFIGTILRYIGTVLQYTSYFLSLMRSKYFVWSLVMFFTFICMVQVLGTLSFMLAISWSIISSVFL